MCHFMLCHPDTLRNPPVHSYNHIQSYLLFSNRCSLLQRCLRLEGKVSAMFV